MNIEIAPQYIATACETKWYETWEANGCFQPGTDPARPNFSITIPPPNITGSLHMGHALCYSLQDALGRYQRLKGSNVLILPGQDHAGIATQSVVEKSLKKEGLSGSKIGREAFIEKVWEWRKTSGDTIISQFKALGCSFDWSRLRFTLDPDYAQAVIKVFVDWHKKGYIYRGKRVVNWDPKLKTSVSDIETLREVRRGKLYHLRYEFADGSGSVVIATTRPETMLGDVAVAVHPSDDRYKGMIGKMLVLPLSGREIPLVADLYPDPEFGTGAVKITPAHDANDFEVGQRHSLPMPVILDLSARVDLSWIKENEPNIALRLEKYEGLDRNEARKEIVADLEACGALVEIEDHEIAMIISDRSGEVIEPLLSEQWFARQSELAQPVIEQIKSGEISFHPARFDELAVNWLENIRDWNVSRQLWWGHRIPAFYTEAGNCFVAESWEAAQTLAGEEKIIRQEEDVLDTWFSSGLWPFATMGWPEKTADLAQFYPTSVLVTDRNIINLWVARMAMMGNDLIGKRPFDKVMIHATVLREDGRRMSKSLGTGIDPMDVINEAGADALRWTLLSQTGENQELRYSERKVTESRNFCNKIWNATRFILMNITERPSTPTELTQVDHWLLTRLDETTQKVEEAYEAYDFQSACSALYRFFWGDVCDWYIEISKPRLQNEATKSTPQWVLLKVIETFLHLVHPVMPFISEELYSHLPIDRSGLICESSWPKPVEIEIDLTAAQEVERVFGMVRSVRALRAEIELKPMQWIEEASFDGDLGDNAWIVESQAWIRKLSVGKPAGQFVSTTTNGIDFHLAIDESIDLEKIVASIERDLAKSETEVVKLGERLNNPQFVERAKPEIIERDRAQLDELVSKIEKLKARKQLFSV